MSEERFKEIEDTIKDLSKKVVHLDKSFGEMNVSLKDYSAWSQQLEKTIRHLDETVNEMNLSHQKIPYDRLRDIKSSIDPIHEMLRKHENIFMSKSHAHSLSAVAIFFISGIILIVGAFGNYVLTDIKTDIVRIGDENKGLIIKNSGDILKHMADKERD